MYIAVEDEHDNLWGIDSVAFLIKGLATFTFGICRSVLSSVSDKCYIFVVGARTRLISEYLNVAFLTYT